MQANTNVEDSKKHTECVICMQEFKAHQGVSFPCGHASQCSQCVYQLMKRSSSQFACPFCRRNVALTCTVAACIFDGKSSTMIDIPNVNLTETKEDVEQRIRKLHNSPRTISQMTVRGSFLFSPHSLREWCASRNAYDRMGVLQMIDIFFFISRAPTNLPRMCTFVVFYAFKNKTSRFKSVLEFGIVFDLVKCSRHVCVRDRFVFFTNDKYIFFLIIFISFSCPTKNICVQYNCSFFSNYGIREFQKIIHS